MRGGGCGAGWACSPRRGVRGLGGGGECPLPPSPPAESPAACSGSARIAHQHNHRSATIGIFSTTAIQMIAQVISAMVPGPVRVEQGLPSRP